MYNERNKKNRFKSKIAWTSLVGLVILIFSTFGLFEKIGITESQATKILEMLLFVLVGFGILNNPSNNEF